MDNTTAPSVAARHYRVGSLSYTRADLVQVVFWMLLGVVSFQMLQMLPSTAVPLQLRWAGASDTLIGFKSTLSSLVMFFWYPVVGTRSDGHRSRWGRRRPFLLWSIPPIVLCMFLLGAARPAGSVLHEVLAWLGLGAQSTAAGCTIAWILGCVVVLMFCNAFLVQIFSCLVADVIPPDVMGKYSGFHRALGALGSLAFNRWVLPWVQDYPIQTYLVIAGLYAVVFSLIVWRVKEGDYPPPPPRAPGGRIGAIKGYVRECFTHPFYLNFYVVTFFNWASLAPMAYLVFFATEAGKPGYAPTLGLSLAEYGKVMGWTFLVQILVFLVVGYFVDRFHPVRVAVVGMLLESVSYISCFWLVHDANSLLLWQCLNQAAIAVYLGAYMALAPRLLPRSRYGQFIGANTVFGISSLIVAPLLVGELLNLIRDYRFVYLLCAFCTVVALIASWTLFLQWRRRGGDTGFQPPETAGAADEAPANAKS